MSTARSGWLALGCALVVLACDGSSPAPPPADAADAVEPASAEGTRPRRERPLPAFSGRTLEGEELRVASLLGKRLLIFFFNPEFGPAAPVADAVVRVSRLRAEHNFEVLGIGVGSSRKNLEGFVAEHGLDFTVIDDSAASITRRLRLQARVGLIGVDADGYLTFGMNEFPSDTNVEAQVEILIRQALRLPESSVETAPLLGSRPPAPDFEARQLGEGESFRLSEHRGRPVVLIFFLHTCPHCHHALESLEETLDGLPEDKRPLLVGVEITGRSAAVRQELKTRNLDFFPVLFDDDGSIREAYGVFAGVPDTVLIDAQGRISARVKGWKDKLDPPLMRMRVSRLAGAPVPMLLRAKGYSGNEICGVCHESEYETWSLTTHATAFGTLVQHGAESNAECVSCHVVGHGEPGGFEDSLTTPYLENVGCETCHGRGGPHLSGKSDGFESTCVECHDAKHSLGFEYASFLPTVSHAANAHLANLSLEEKQKLLAERGRPRQALLPTKAAYVGSDACRSCHEAEYTTWAGSGHATAFESLGDKAANEECQVCHSTGLGKPGGFPGGADAASHADLARVGCESCHGPGGDHVAEGAVKLGSVVSLGDKCDSCVILQICGSCHDDANDPGFEFEVQDKIDAQRHGTIEAGTGKPLGEKAARGPTHDLDLVARALALFEEGT